MDLSNLVTSENEKDGKWFRVELYGKKQDFALCLLGNDSEEVISFQREQMRNLKSFKKDVEEMTDDELAELLETGNEAILIRIKGISSIKVNNRFSKDFELTDEPVKLGDVELKPEVKSYRLLLEKIPAIKEFILKTSQERTNFLN